ncbi:hypothetical protein [Sneathiella glossodoripedis]|uniref:hypothetical protein n=1 Tax=Sneathiella glossodoripedis TaxID=418853 RepID=UPI00047027C7|nr:hypothetical protein [Sneathiella glossodoripedis]
MYMIKYLLLYLTLFFTAGASATEITEGYSRVAWTHYLAGEYKIVEDILNKKSTDPSGSDLYLKYLISEAHFRNIQVPISYDRGITYLKKAVAKSYAPAFQELAFLTWIGISGFGTPSPGKFQEMLELLLSWKNYEDSRYIEYVARMLEREFKFGVHFYSDQIFKAFPQFQGMSTSQIYEQNFRTLNDPRSAIFLARSLTMDIWAEQYTDIETESFDALVKHLNFGVYEIYPLFAQMYKKGFQIKANAGKAYEYYLITAKMRPFNLKNALTELDQVLSDAEKSAAQTRADSKFEKLRAGSNFYSKSVNWCYFKLNGKSAKLRQCKIMAWADHLICNKPIPISKNDYHNSIAYSDCRFDLRFLD